MWYGGVWVWFLLFSVILLLLLTAFTQRYSLLASRLTAINFSFFSARKIVAHYFFDILILIIIILLLLLLLLLLKLFAIAIFSVKGPALDWQM